MTEKNEILTEPLLKNEEKVEKTTSDEEDPEIQSLELPKIPISLKFFGDKTEEIHPTDTYPYTGYFSNDKVGVFINEGINSLMEEINRISNFFLLLLCAFLTCFIPVIGIFCCLCVCCLILQKCVSIFQPLIDDEKRDEFCRILIAIVELRNGEYVDGSGFARNFIAYPFFNDVDKESYKWEITLSFLAKSLKRHFFWEEYNMSYDEFKEFLSKEEPFEMVQVFVGCIKTKWLVERVKVILQKDSKKLSKKDSVLRDVDKSNFFNRLDFTLKIVSLKVLTCISEGQLNEALLCCNKVLECYSESVPMEYKDKGSDNAEYFAKYLSDLIFSNKNPRILFFRGLVNELCCEFERANDDYSNFIEIHEKQEMNSITANDSYEELSEFVKIAKERKENLFRSLKTENYEKHIKDLDLRYMRIDKFISLEAKKQSLIIASKRGDSNQNITILEEVEFGGRNFSEKDLEKEKIKKIPSTLKGCSFKDFEPIRRLGKKNQKSKKGDYFGSNADIYLCRHKKSKRLFVMKVFVNMGVDINRLKELSDLENTRLRYHKNIITVLYSKIEKIDYNILPDSVFQRCDECVRDYIQNETVFYIMEYYPTNLQSYVNERRKQKNEIKKIEFLEMSVQLLEGIVYIKKNRFVHRDLKPENIFVDAEYGKLVIGIILICFFKFTGDFGESLKVKIISSLLGDFSIEFKNINKVGVGGSTYYLPPEILKDVSQKKKVDFSKADVWAVGLIMYFLLSEKDPFSGKQNDQRIQSDYIDLDPGSFGVEICNLVKSMVLIDFGKRISDKKALGICRELLKREKKT